jgi:hypothetical protein
MPESPHICASRRSAGEIGTPHLHVAQLQDGQPKYLKNTINWWMNIRDWQFKV